MKLLLGVFCVASALVFSGCTGVVSSQANASGSSVPQAPAPAPDDTTGSIQGTVVSDEQAAIVDAIVGIPALSLSTTTDSTGAFTLNGVPPGEQTVAAQKLGYESAARKVSVQAGAVIKAEFVLTAVAVETPRPLLQIKTGNIQCSVRAYPGVPTTGAGGLPVWTTGVAVCGVASLPGFAADNFLVRWETPIGMREVMLEMTWSSTQALGRGLSVVLEHDPHANDLKYTFGTATGKSPITIYANENKTMTVANTSSIDCFTVKCKLYSRAFAEANTTDLYLPGSSPDLGPAGKPPWKVDVGFTFDQKFTQYVTTFQYSTRTPGYTALKDR